MDNIFVLLTLFLIIPTIAEAKCSYDNGVNRFGDNCGFMCHCKGNRECDVVTGECSSGCARGWYGPGCQYRDILEDKHSKFSDNGYSLLVTDGDSRTCLRQVKSSTTKLQSWSVRLSSNETINEIQIVTTSESLDYFKNFEVFVGYSPLSGNDETVKQKTCFRQGVGIPKSTTFTVLCDNPVIGNYVKIVFAELPNELELCDVKINGGRNLAFNRAVSQVSKHSGCHFKYCNAEASVNGQTRELNQWICSYTAKENNPWWRVDIGYQMKIWSVQIISVIDCPENRCGYNCEKECHCEHATIWEKIYGNCSISCNKKDKDDQCNTKCPTGKYGEECKKNCSSTCKQGFCNHVNGKCLYGCEPGYQGKKCQNICDNGYYGQNCSKRCSYHCRHGNRYCNAVNGTCIDGCRRGWKEPFCETCEAGFFGKRCKNTCSQHCEGGITKCNNTNGQCKNGCKPGWTEPLCIKSCDRGYFGQKCFKKCNDHCKYGNEHCNKVDGNCTYGCMDGWKAPFCDQACDTGFYGQNCEEKCTEHCAGGSRNCNTTTGNCEMGCQPGWIGLRCVNACPPRKFGAGCDKNCTVNCKNDTCDHVNGICHDGCKPGYRGNKCTSECDPGTFGENCQEKCSTTCKNGVCSHLYGRCSNGCKPGYHGNKCEQKCPDGKFGEECKQNCSSKCNNNMCDHVTGNCTNGYKPGYKGNTCGEISDKILSDTNPCTGCHETPKSNIVLICVGILCAIVVVYATVITILFKRNSTHNGAMMMLLQAKQIKQKLSQLKQQQKLQLN